MEHVIYSTLIRRGQIWIKVKVSVQIHFQSRKNLAQTELLFIATDERRRRQKESPVQIFFA